MGKLFGKLFNKSEDSGKWTNTDFIEGAYEGLQLQTAAHKTTWKLGEESNWNVDLNQGTLTFVFSDGKVSTNIQVVGTYNSADGTFLWGWDHPSVPDNLAEHAEFARAWGEKNNEALFTELNISCSVDDVWKISATVNRLAEANGVYLGNSNGTYVFMTMGTLKMSK